MRKDADGEFRIVYEIEDRQAEGDDRGFVMLPRPEIEVVIRGALHFPAALEKPSVAQVRAPQDEDQQEKQVGRA